MFSRFSVDDGALGSILVIHMLADIKTRIPNTFPSVCLYHQHRHHKRRSYYRKHTDHSEHTHDNFVLQAGSIGFGFWTNQSYGNMCANWIIQQHDAVGCVVGRRCVCRNATALFINNAPTRWSTPNHGRMPHVCMLAVIWCALFVCVCAPMLCISTQNLRGSRPVASARRFMIGPVWIDKTHTAHTRKPGGNGHYRNDLWSLLEAGMIGFT